jgi:DNA (cytosine-5)-methyltransferase 1
VDTRTLSICSGYGGIELGLSAVIPGIRTVCYVEREVEACEILGARIKDGVIDDAPIWTDLRTFDATAWRGQIHILTGGFPCQPHSVAGLRKGETDPRELSGEVLRIADELGRPTLFLENVPGIKKFWFNNVRPKLQGMGYRVEEVFVTASETGAPHKRQRLFILAHHEKFGHGGWNSFWGGTEQRVIQPQEQRGDKMGSQTEGCGVSLAHPTGRRQLESVGTIPNPVSERLQGVRWCSEGESVQTKGSIRLYPPGPSDTRGWEHVFSQMPSLIPTFCRVANGSTPRVSRQLRAGGNGVVPAMAARAWQLLSERFIN